VTAGRTRSRRAARVAQSCSLRAPRAGPARRRGVRVGLTHSRAALPGMAARLAALGLEVEWQPLVSTEPRPAAAEEALALAGCAWLVFPSPSAVEVWFSHALPSALTSRHGDEAVQHLGRGRDQGGPALAALGAGTAAALEARGHRADLVGGGDAGTTALALVAATRSGERVGLVQGELARPTLRSLLEEAGRDVRAATVYRTLTRPWDGDPADVTVFASPSAVRAFGAGALARTRPVAIGATTLQELKDLGAAASVAASPDVEGVAAAIEAAAADLGEGGGERARASEVSHGDETAHASGRAHGDDRAHLGAREVIDG